MFQFTTTNVINSNKDLSTGLELWSMQKATETKGASFNVKRVGNFCADNIVSVYKAGYVEPTLSKIVFDLTTLKGEDKDRFRISLYIRLTQGSNYSLYANDTYYKGRPFFVDFVWKTDAATTAAILEKNIKKYFIEFYGEKIVKVKAVGDTIEIEAVNEYQRFTKADIEKLDAEAYHGLGDFEVIATARTIDDPEFDGGNQLTEGVEGFGTYRWILHNLRIPTSTRTGFMAINQEETPIPGALYNQYTIHYCVNRGTLGSNAVGDQVTSHTTHVFYVKSDLAADFEAALKQVAPEGKITEVPAAATENKPEDEP